MIENAGTIRMIVAPTAIAYTGFRTGIDAGAGWRLALLLTGAAIAPLALVAWWASTRREAREVRGGSELAASRLGIWRDPIAWQVGALTVAFAMRGRAARITPTALPLLGFVGIIGLMIQPDAIGIWVVPLGLFSGLSLGVSLTLMAERARDHRVSSALSGMSQSVGYAIAAVGPALFGAVHAMTGNWTISLIILLVTMTLQAVFGAYAARDHYVLEPRAH